VLDFVYEITPILLKIVKEQKMASAIAVMRKKIKTQGFEEGGEDGGILENLVTKLPPMETWDAEYCLDVLVLG
jgi:hypothetical protein